MFAGDGDYMAEQGDSGTGNTDAGVVASTRSGMQLPPIWRAVNLISTYVAKIPLIVYRRVDPKRPEKGKERAYDHPAYGLLARKCSPEMLALHLKATLTAHALFTGKGNGYAYIKRLGDGTPVEIWVLNPLRTWPVRVNGVLEYLTYLNASVNEKNELYGGEVRRLPACDVIHIRGLGFDGLVGYDVITYMCETIGLSTGLRKFGSVFFRNYATPGTVLERPIDAPALSPKAEANLRRSFDNLHRGLDNAHRTAVLQEGTKASVLGVDARKAQLTEERLFQVREVATWFGIPPHKLGDPTRTSYNSLEAENQSFLDDCLDYWLCQWELEASDKLVSEADKASGAVFVEALREAVLRTDQATLVTSLANEVNNGLMNVDEARAIRNRGPLPNGLGRKFRMPANYVIIGETAKPDSTPVAPDPSDDPAIDADPEGDIEPTEAARGVLHDAVLRMVKRLFRQAQRAMAKPDGLAAWSESCLSANRSVIVEALGPACQLMRSMGKSLTCDRGADILCRTIPFDLENGGFRSIAEPASEAALAELCVKQMLDGKE